MHTNKVSVSVCRVYDSSYIYTVMYQCELPAEKSQERWAESAAGF